MFFKYVGWDILKIEQSYWSRVANEEILAKAHAIMAKKDWTTQWRQFLPENRTAKPKIKLLSQIQEERKRRLLGHIIRTNEGDPLRQVCFDEEGYQYLYETRRVGRPRNHWVRETMKETYIELTEDVVYDEHDQDTILKIFCAAEGRMF